MDTLAVFRSRSEALQIYNLLKKHHIACITVNTPTSLGFGCGISIVFNSSCADKIKLLLSEKNVSSFVGFFKK